jgi:outer membrane protein
MNKERTRAPLRVFCVALVTMAAGITTGRGAELPAPEGLRERVANGKLRLGLEDVIELALLNRTDVRLSRLDMDAAHYAALGERQSFDPELALSLDNSRQDSLAVTSLPGAAPLDAGQQGNLRIAQTLPTGTHYELSLSGTRNGAAALGSSLAPSPGSSLRLEVKQTLLGRDGPFANHARLLRAELGLEQSRSSLEVRLSDAIVEAADAYWTAVQARESLAVTRHSLELAQASYERDQCALELGALPPLDIFRSESTVASRRLQVIEAEYSLKRALEQVRRQIGADQEDRSRSQELELTDSPEPSGELLTVDGPAVVEQARKRRPELGVMRRQLGGAEAGLRAARSALQPGLSISAFGATGGDTSDVSAWTRLRNLDLSTYGVSVSLDFSLRNHGAAAELGQAKVAREQTLYRIRELEQSVVLDAQRAVDDLEKAKLSLSVARLARDLARKTLDAEQRKRELGESTLFFVLEAQAALSDSELSLLRAGIEYQRAVTSVAHATGTLLERHRVQIAANGLAGAH